jgi:hydrogenase expression/formation protein HypD
MENRYRDQKTIESLAASIHRRCAAINRRIKVMNVCGSHERSIAEWGLRDLLPEQLELIPGPGCPVCVCAEHDIGEAIEISKRGVTILSFGDMLRVRTQYGSLMDARSDGSDVRIIYSPDDAVEAAGKEPGREFVLFAVGFETTAAPMAALFSQQVPPNFSLLTALKLTAPAVETLVLGGRGASTLDGLLAPGHVAVITGAQDWERFPARHNLPVAVAGFEPVDVLAALEMIMRMLERGKPELANEYARYVKPSGNRSAQSWMKKVFRVERAFWRAIGWVQNSGLFLADDYRAFDARAKYGVCLEDTAGSDVPKGCICHMVVLGQSYPRDCALFEKNCTMMDPVGPCMVSEEGACHIWSRFGAAVTRRS